jgi:protocatechuate 3,4-dioxygenase beta subunit
VITQMYFPGEALNDKDLLLQNIRTNQGRPDREGAAPDIGC